MSSKTDVIYSHKKFKKASLEACERKETERKSEVLHHRHHNDVPRPTDNKIDELYHNGSNNCLQTFHSKGDHQRYEVLLPNSVQNNETFEEVREASALLGRSISLPIDPDAKTLSGSKVFDNEPKPIYKPKFRAQYSIEDTSIASQGDNLTGYYSLLSKANTYHGSSVSTYTSSDHFGHISLKRFTEDAPQKVKGDPASSRPTCSRNLWKGIKSPSPELVGQHITNLIVRNKAIVETHSPFWPMKYRRQSSMGSMLDAESQVKVKRSTSEIKCKNYSTSKSPHCVQYDTSIDHKSQLNLVASNQATNCNISAHPVTTIRHVKYTPNNFKGATGVIDETRKVRVGILTQSPHSSNHRISRQPSMSEVPVVQQQSNESDKHCSLCGVVVDSGSMLYHLKTACRKSINLEVSAKGDKVDQDEALDLQMRKSFIRNKQLITDNQDHLQKSSSRKLSDREQNCAKYPYQICSISNPKLNTEQNVEFANVVLSNVNLSNGKMYCQNKCGAQTIDELQKPKSNNNLIYGGEVKICDGNAFKTLKIDSMKNETPSLDLCIASKHLGGRDPSLQAQPQTSVVVKFAKCGLNSGGTMVKVDSRKYQNTKVTYPSQLPHSFYSPNERSCENDTEVSTPLMHNSSLTLIPISSPISTSMPLQSESFNENAINSTCAPARDCRALRISISPVKRESPQKQQLTSVSNKPQKDDCPVVFSIAVNNAPYVPGIPGPYSQHNGVIPIRPVDLASSRNTSCSNFGSTLVESTAKIKTNNISFVYSDNIDIGCSSPLKSDMKNLSLSEPTLLDSDPQTSSDSVPSDSSSSREESCFVVPRKRPSTLPIRATQLNKSSLIGSTLVSPDTPRPKKSCAQLLLNGSAYTYLNMKVSTKTFFCCIYRPQPMYVLQAANSKLSMYSNWKVRKTEDSLNLSPSQLMSSYASGVYYDRGYTTANTSDEQMIITSSSPDETSYKVVFDQQSRENSPEKSPLRFEGSSAKRKSEDEASEDGTGKRVKIFEGGFKTNEEYTYVRGRGRGRYVCETCGIRCKKPSMLKKHIRTHTDLRPFSCIHCSFSFKTKGNLTKHLKSKAHYKRCTEMGIQPVPTVVDDTHINKEALELQGKIDLTINSCHSADDEDYSDDDNDESDDEEFDELDDEEKCSESAHDLSTSYDSFPEIGQDFQSEGPIDLSIKRIVEKNKRPKSLTLMRGPSTPTGFSQGVHPLTPIKEQPDEILSPVTESSHLLKSIYDTTLRVSKATKKVVSDPGKEPGCGSPMLQKYLREMAVLGIARKRKYIKVAECQLTTGKRMRNQDCSETPPIIGNTTTKNNPLATNTLTTSSQFSSASDIAAAIIVSCETSNHVEETVVRGTPSTSPFIPSSMILQTRKRESSPIAYRNSPCHPMDVSHTMSSVPANMVVINTSGSESKASFMSPSGVIPTPQNRPGCDDGKSKCVICQKEFSKQSQLSLHMNIHYIERPHRCESCGVSFRTSGHLQKHMRSVSHYNKLNMNMTFGTPSTENPRPFKCQDCKSAFRIHGHLAKHLRSKLHIMRLECLGKLPFGTYAEIERSGVSLNEIDTSDCENSLDSLQVMASKMHEKDPTKLTAWTDLPKSGRLRTVSNSSNNSEDYLSEDEQDQKQADDELEFGIDDEQVDGSIESGTNDEDNIESGALSSSGVTSEGSNNNKLTD